MKFVVLWQPDVLNLLMLARVARRAVLARALSVDASRGRELAGQGRLREAADAFRTAARAAPARADDHAALGEVLLQLGELDEAERALRAAVRADASHSLAHCNLGQLLGQRASELCPDPAAVSADAAAEALFAEAEAAFAAAVAADGANATAMCGLGTCAEIRGDAAAAEAAYRSALDADPTHRQAHFCLAEQLQLRREIGEARVHFEAAGIDTRGLQWESAAERAADLDDEARRP